MIEHELANEIRLLRNELHKKNMIINTLRRGYLNPRMVSLYLHTISSVIYKLSVTYSSLKLTIEQDKDTSSQTANLERYIEDIEILHGRWHYMYYGIDNFFYRGESTNSQSLKHYLKEIFAALKLEGIHNISLMINFQEDTQLLMPPIEIYSVFLNLLINAITAIIRVRPHVGKINIEAIAVDDFTDFNVTDNGYGIPENIMNDIWLPYYSEWGEEGIGLYLVKEIVEEYKGSIKVTSQVGEFTTFTLRIPSKRI